MKYWIGVGDPLSNKSRRYNLVTAMNPWFMPYKFMFPILFLVLLSSVHLHAQSYPGSRRISCQQDDISFSDFFRIIFLQTQMKVFYNEGQLHSSERISIQFLNEPLDNVLALLIGKRGLGWCYKNETLVISFREKVEMETDELPESKRRTISGLVVNEKEEPLGGVSIITENNSAKKTITYTDGRFILDGIEKESKLLVHKPGYKSMELASYADSIYIQLVPVVAPLPEVFINASKRITYTGSVSSITQHNINDQPISNVLSALQGKVSGLYISQATGLPGGGYKIRLRGRNSIESVNTPLILVDGFPFPAVSVDENFLNMIGSGSVQEGSIVPRSLDLLNGNITNNNMEGTNRAASSLNLLNINDIASIDVLKDADATAIYGARGANGVILINRKTPGGKKGFNVNIYSGFGKAVHPIHYLDTKQYLEMRREAITKDEKMIDTSDYDLNNWDPTKYTDWQKVLIGETARITEGNIEYVGGGAITYRLSGLYRNEGTVYPSHKFRYKKAGSTLQVDTKAIHQKLDLGFVINYVADQNFLPATDLTTLSTLSPNAPDVYTIDNKLNFADSTFAGNPFAYLQRTYKAGSKNIGSSLKLDYEIDEHLKLHANIGCNLMRSDIIQVNPSSSFYSSTGEKGYTYFYESRYKNTLLDFQGTWEKTFGKNHISLLLGARFQTNGKLLQSIEGTEYENDSLLDYKEGAGELNRISDLDTLYRYQSLYGRFEYRYKNKYLLSLTITRDGSTRLSPTRQYHIFGSLGGAWIFSDEDWFNKNGFISYGKLHGSLGFTGNDQHEINYNNQTYIPSSVLPGSDSKSFTWEHIRRAELAITLASKNDRVMATFCYYNNRSTNQLLSTSYSYPVNFPAVVKNTGLEIDIESVLVSAGKITWESTFNFSLPKNKLALFPDIAETNYRYFYNIGMSLDMVQTFRFLGVDPQTGMYDFERADKNAPLTIKDFKYGKELGPVFYGGLLNTFRIKPFEINFFIRFAKQNNYDHVFASGIPSPGVIGYNQSASVLNRWQNPGQHAAIQKLTADMSSEAGQAFSNALFSDRQMIDASYIRLQSFSLAYYLTNKKLERAKITSCKIYLQGVNLFTLTKYTGRDPEMVTSVSAYPALRVVTAGIQVSF